MSELASESPAQRELHFNTLPTAEATARLLTCLAVPRWAAEVVAGRPYDNLAALTKQAEAAAATLTDDELAAALARHPRIGERAGRTTTRRSPGGNRPPWRRTTN